MRFPLSANLDDDLKVVIQLHEFYLGDRDRQCWTYVTQGLAKYGQQEMSLSLLVDDGADPESFPKTPVRMFQLLANRARANKKIRHGDATKLGHKGIFSFPCAFYVPAIQYPDIPELDDTLALILVHQNEYDYARRYGITRFMARLGRFCSSFPYPTWNTQRRPSLFMGDVEEPSLLNDLPVKALPHSYVHQLSDVLQLQLHKDDVKAALESLSKAASDEATSDEPSVLSTAFSSRCDAGLYWQEGQDGPGAYAAPEAQSEMIGGSFVAISRNDATGFEVQEDGFALALTAKQIIDLTAAMNKFEGFECQLGKQRFILESMKPVGSVESVEGLEGVQGVQGAEGAVGLEASARQRARLYEPVAVWRSLKENSVPIVAESTPAAIERSPEQPVPIVRAGRFINLTGEKSLIERVETEALNDYIHRIEQTLLGAMSDEVETFTFDVTLTIYPASAKIELSHVADLNPEFIAFVEQTVMSLTPCSVTSQIRIRIPFSVNDG
jgi:hypothetical protein